MEITGIMVGGVGLAALFDSCMGAFEYFDSGKAYGKDYQRSALRISALQVRLSRWGRNMIFLNDATSLSGAATQVEADLVRSVLGQIAADLNAAEEASTRYKVLDTPADGGLDSLETLAGEFRLLALRRQKKTSMGSKARWALLDRRRLDDLIANIKAGIGDLESLFPAIAPGSAHQLEAAVEEARELVEAAHAATCDKDEDSTLTVLQDITADVDSVLHRAIQIASEHVRAGDSFKNMIFGESARTSFGDFVASGYTGPGPTEKVRNQTFDTVQFGKNARTTFGDNYGGKSVFDDWSK